MSLPKIQSETFGPCKATRLPLFECLSAHNTAQADRYAGLCQGQFETLRRSCVHVKASKDAAIAVVIGGIALVAFHVAYRPWAGLHQRCETSAT